MKYNNKYNQIYNNFIIIPQTIPTYLQQFSAL